MLFNSNEFLVFFAVFFTGYVLAQGSLFLRNLLIVVGSYVFYSGWDIRFTPLLFFTSFVDYLMGLLMEKAPTKVWRKAFLCFSVVLNLGVLCVFKYFNFLRDSFEPLFSGLGVTTQWKAWDIVLPIGISFYTFQSMSYVIDVYRKDMPASRNLLQFLAYVSFFPQLVAGPIERGTNLIPQFSRVLTITRAQVEAGVWLIIWGLFKKVVIADNLAPLVELVFQNSTVSGPITVMGTIAFGLQIYCDFSGYCDVASGLANVLGFKLMLNFDLPYSAVSLRDFWRRWHISLSTWLRDYLYRPLGGNRGRESRTYLNLLVTMLLGGLWHGAAINFVLWGLWHGVGLIMNRLWSTKFPGKVIPDWLGWLLTQAFVLYGWMLFRATSLEQIMSFTRSLGTFSLPTWWFTYLVNLVVIATPLVAMQIWQWRTRKLDIPLTLPGWVRAGLQAVLLLFIISYWQTEAVPFIYFQF